MTKEEIIADRKRYQKKLNINRIKRLLWFIVVFISIYFLFDFYDNTLFTISFMFIQTHTYKKLKKLDETIHVLKMCVAFLEVAEDPSNKSKVEKVIDVLK